jgi:putative resolvase
MIDEIMNHKVEKVVITHKDRLSRVGFELFRYLFAKFRTGNCSMKSIRPVQ